MPERYRNRLDHVSKRLGIRRSDVIRLAMKQFLEGIDERPLQSPYARARHLLGIVESNVKDLGQSHRRYLTFSCCPNPERLPVDGCDLIRDCTVFLTSLLEFNKLVGK